MKVNYFRAAANFTMKRVSVVFLGSFQHYSTLVAEALVKNDSIKVVGVVTTPPQPAGRKKVLTKTHIHEWAERQRLPVVTPQTLDSASLRQLVSSFNTKVDLFVVAGYRNKLPKIWLEYPRLGAYNLHQSLLPKYRGTNPAEWAILTGEAETGVSLIRMTERFDAGPIIGQRSFAIAPNDTRESLYEKLYQTGGELTAEILPLLEVQHLKGKVQPRLSPTRYARRLARHDGFIDWLTIVKARRGGLTIQDFTNNQLLNYLIDDSISQAGIEPVNDFLVKLIERAVRALYGYPYLWTVVETKKGQKRLRILAVQIEGGKLKLNRVQIEGQQAARFNQIKNLISA